MRSSICQLLVSSTLIIQMASAANLDAQHAGSGIFSGADSFKYIVGDRIHENVIFSPASIGTCLALAYFGADGDTADEMRTGLGFGADKEKFGEQYGAFIKNNFGGKSEEGPVLKMANRIYVNKGLEIAPKFNEAAGKYFNAEAEQVEFAHSSETVNKINSWVEDNTNHKIKNLLEPSAVDGQTSSVLVNAIYFKGKWENPFSNSSTQKADFSVSAKDKVSVDMMYNDDKFKYAELADLDATAIELPYKDSDISMLIVLPNKVDGLQELEKHCEGKKLQEIVGKLQFDSVTLKLPKFRIEFDIDLKEPLSKMGVKKMFTDAAEFGSLFATKESHKVDKVQHKAFLDVNEAGSEAAAATFLKIVPLSLNLKQKRFIADHPFVFVIRDSQAVYFAGHVVKF